MEGPDGGARLPILDSPLPLSTGGEGFGGEGQVSERLASPAELVAHVPIARRKPDELAARHEVAID
jgi:hypothetical protein